ncbi:transposase, IS30 family, partial [Delftia lacustris]
MKQRPRIYYTEAQKAMMWDRWSKGDTLHQIGKLFDRPHTSIQNILAATGGIRPPARHRSRLALTLAEREEISRALAAGESIHWAAAGFDDTLLRWQMKPEVVNGEKKDIQSRV